MSEERLQEIKDSVEFQYKLAKAKCIDNALLFADEERELIEEIERQNKRIKELEEGFKASTEDLCEESTKIEKAIEYIKKHTYHDTPKKLQNGIYERGILLIKSDFDIEELLEILDKGE